VLWSANVKKLQPASVADLSALNENTVHLTCKIPITIVLSIKNQTTQAVIYIYKLISRSYVLI